jgi:hypothetical protein
MKLAAFQEILSDLPQIAQLVAAELHFQIQQLPTAEFEFCINQSMNELSLTPEKAFMKTIENTIRKTILKTGLKIYGILKANLTMSFRWLRLRSVTGLIALHAGAGIETRAG